MKIITYGVLLIISILPGTPSKDVSTKVTQTKTQSVVMNRDTDSIQHQAEKLLFTPKSHQVLFASAESARIDTEIAEKAYLDSMEEILTRLEVAIGKIRSEDTLGERLTISQLRQVISPFREQAHNLVELHQNYEQAAESFETEVRKAVPLMRQAAAQFAAYAKDEKFDELKKSYLNVAESMVTVAQKFETQKSQVAPATRSVAELIEYVEHADLFLLRLEAVLGIFPEESLAAEDFLRQVTEYLHAFERLRELLENFHQATTGQLPTSNAPAENPDLVTSVTKRIPSRLVSTQKPSASKKSVVPEPPRTTKLNQNRQFDDPSGKADPSFGEQPKVQPVTKPKANSVIPAVDLTGNWSLGNGTVCLRFVQQGEQVTASLHRGNQVVSAHGKFHFTDSQALQIDQLVYELKSGQQVDLSGHTWRVVDRNHIAGEAQTYQRTQDGRLYRTSTMKRFHVRRIQ